MFCAPLKPARSRALRGLLIAVVAVGASASTAIAAGPPGALSARLDALATQQLRSASVKHQADRLSLPVHGAGSLLRSRGDLVVEVRATSASDRLRGELRAAGARIIDASRRYRTVTAAVAPGELRPVAAVRGVRAVNEDLTPMTASAGRQAAAPIPGCVGAASSEGDGQLRADAARQNYGVSGAGVRVGILSDSFDRGASTATHAAGDVASGDLPGAGNPCGRDTPVQLLDDTAGGTDEGRAMAQIVHDLAPDAAISFATAFTGETSFADNIRALRTAGARVIVDDVTYFDEPFFQDGPVSVAVNDVTGAGAAYYSSAANSNVVLGGNNVSSWEAPSFRSMSCPAGTPGSATPGQCMDFNPASGTDNAETIRVSNGGGFSLDLQWAEPWYGVGTDINAYVLNSGNQVVASSVTVNTGVSGSQKPFEFLTYRNTTGSSQNVRIVLNKRSGTATPRLKYVLLGAAGISSVEYRTSTGGDVVGPTIFGHNGAANAISTAAVPYSNSATVESYSSRGPVTLYYGPVNGASPAAALGSPQVIAKPDIAATDGGANTFFGSLSSGKRRFFGTSAAAPHAAAVGALAFEASPSATVSQVKSALVGGARPVGSFGPTAVGAGVVDADAAVGTLQVPGPPTVTGTDPPSPANQNTPRVNGSARSNSTVSVYSNSSCSGQPVATGTAAAFASPGLAVTVADDSTTTFYATATGPAGTSSCSPSAIAYVEDSTAPEPPQVTATAPASPANQNSLAVEGAAEASSTVSLYKTSDCGGAPAAQGTASSFASPGLTASVANNSSTSFHATATDQAGNTSSCSTGLVYVEDSIAPDTAIDSGPSGPTGADTPTFGFSSSESGSSFECRIDDGSFDPCSGPGASHTTAHLTDGLHSVYVRAVDAASNVDPSAARRSFVVDTSPPETTITTGPAGVIGNPVARFSFSTSSAASTFQCRLDSGAWSACSSPQAMALADGAHSFRVRSIDAVGNVDPTPATRRIIVDTSPPETTITSSPAALTNDGKLSFGFFSSQAESTFMCSIDAGPWSACSSPVRKAFSDGFHTFRVRATDPAGNVDATPAMSAFTVDATPPDTVIGLAPTALTNRAPRFGFSSSQPGSRFECSLDSRSWGPCDSPMAMAALGDGSHSFTVRAIDRAGNVDPTPAEHLFRLDTTPPQTTIDSGPKAKTGKRTAAFELGASEADTSFVCKVDTDPYAPCESPATTDALADGGHTFRVIATDRAGNADPTPENRHWRIHASR